MKGEGQELTGQTEGIKGDTGTYRQRLYVVDVIIVYSTYLLPYSNLPYCHFVFCFVQL